ncbi:hypothetical protein GOBAR_DD02855 [Gossypium barbadense]|nr:hypothetical protein GOBAR_DD02855 [Gossypium barbadense]
MSLSDDGGKVVRSSEDRDTKKVRFKGGNGEASVDMVVDVVPTSPPSWKDKFLGGASFGSNKRSRFVLLERDMIKSTNNEILTINFSDHIQTVILKLLENGYFLAKFQSADDYDKVLTQGPWIVYGQYLTVQPWTKDFSPLQPYPSVVMAWIRLSRLILETIRKHDWGSFARMEVYINLDRLFVSQVLVNGEIQRVEYDSLPDMCTMVVMDRNLKEGVERMTVVTRETDKEDGRALGTTYGP